MRTWGCAAVIALVLTGFAGLLLTGRYDNDGPVVLSSPPRTACTPATCSSSPAGSSGWPPWFR